MATFQAGKTYECRFVTDADASCPITILKRTAKTVTIQDPANPQQTKRCAIQVDLGDGDEFIKPFGSYSMAPYCRARRLMQGPTSARAERRPNLRKVEGLLNDLLG